MSSPIRTAITAARDHRLLWLIIIALVLGGSLVLQRFPPAALYVAVGIVAGSLVWAAAVWLQEKLWPPYPEWAPELHPVVTH